MESDDNFMHKRVPLIIILIVFILGIAGYNYATYPGSWKQIKLGDSPEQVKAKCPDVYQLNHQEKGDWCYRSKLGYKWTLNIIYGKDDRVRAAYLILTVGTESIFKKFELDNIAQ